MSSFSVLVLLLATETTSATEQVQIPDGLLESQQDFFVRLQTPACWVAIPGTFSPGFHAADFLPGVSLELAFLQCTSGLQEGSPPCGAVTCSASGQCTARAGAGLALSRSGETTYQNLCSAAEREACWVPTPSAFSRDFANGDGTRYSLRDALDRCLELTDLCHGVTCSTSGQCTVRSTAALEESPTAETTYQYLCRRPNMRCRSRVRGFLAGGLPNFTEALRRCRDFGTSCDGVEDPSCDGGANFFWCFAGRMPYKDATDGTCVYQIRGV